MFSHIMVGADDIEASRVFYDAVLGTLGCKPGILSVNPTGHTRYLYIHENNMFIISEPIKFFQKNIDNYSLNQNVIDLIDIVGISRNSLDRFPH